MSDVGDNDFGSRLTSRGSSSGMAAEAAPSGEEVASDLEATTQEGAHDDEWHVVEHPAADLTDDQSRAAEEQEAKEENAEHGDDAFAPAPAAEAGADPVAAVSAATSQRSGHSFEHLSDHFGPSGATSMTSSFGSSFDGLIISAASEESDAATEVSEPAAAPGPAAAAATPQAEELFLNGAMGVLPPPEAADTEGCEAAQAPQPMAAPAPAGPVPAAHAERLEDAEAPPPAGPPASGTQSPAGSSYADLGAAALELQDAPAVAAPQGVPQVQAALVEGDKEAPLPEVEDSPSEDEEDESRVEETSRAEGAAGDAISRKAEEEGPAGGAYLRVLRAAIAHLAPTATLTTVWSWIKERLAQLRQLRPGGRGLEQWAGGLGAHVGGLGARASARVAGWDRTTLLLGASGVGLAVLSTLLYTSRQQNQRLRAAVVERDQDIARMMSRIFQLKEALQPRRIPVIHHVAAASAGFSVFPSASSLDFL